MGCSFVCSFEKLYILQAEAFSNSLALIEIKPKHSFILTKLSEVLHDSLAVLPTISDQTYTPKLQESHSYASAISLVLR